MSPLFRYGCTCRVPPSSGSRYCCARRDLRKVRGSFSPLQRACLPVSNEDQHRRALLCVCTQSGRSTRSVERIDDVNARFSVVYSAIMRAICSEQPRKAHNITRANRMSMTSPETCMHTIIACGALAPQCFIHARDSRPVRYLAHQCTLVKPTAEAVAAARVEAC